MSKLYQRPQKAGGIYLRLDFASLHVSGMEWGDRTTIEDGVLFVNRVDAVAACGDFGCFKGIALHIARPGEDIRIVPVKNVIEPRCKMTEEGAIFPGIIGGMKQAGTGSTLALKGAAVVVTQSNDEDGRCRTGGFIDMSGPATEYCPFSSLYNLVLEAKVDPDAYRENESAVDEACHLASLRLSVYLAESCKDLVPDSFTPYDLGDPNAADRELPGVVYVMQMLAQNPLIKDFYIYGQLAGATMLPTVLHPNEIIDGAFTTYIGSHCTVCSDKQYLYEVQNSPVIEELFRLHNDKVRFLGVLVHNEVLTMEGKERCSLQTAKLAEMLGAKGAILVTEGHGNPDEDIMLNVRNLEKAGVKTVIISDELGGRDGRSPGLADWVRECNAMVSVGNTHEILAVPKETGTFIGNPASMEIVHIDIEEQPENPAYFYTEMNHIAGSCAQAGLARLSARWI